MISLYSTGSFRNTERFLTKAPRVNIRRVLEVCGQQGVSALMMATPQLTGQAAMSWYYEVEKDRSGWTVSWYNSNLENGFPVALMLQLGHGTGNGGYVQGIDYINPALRPIFDRILDQAWKAVITA